MGCKNLILGLCLLVTNQFYANETIINFTGLTADQQEIILAQLLKKRGEPGCNLNGIKLIDKDLSNLNLANARIQDSLLLGVNLTNSDLSGALMSNTDFSGAILIHTKLRNADLNGVQNLHQAIYKKCTHFPWSWLPWWEYDKTQLDLQQIAKTLAAGYVVCQANYTNRELDQIAKFK